MFKIEQWNIKEPSNIEKICNSILLKDDDRDLIEKWNMDINTDSLFCFLFYVISTILGILITLSLYHFYS